MTEIPKNEIETVINSIHSHPEYLDTGFVTSEYRKTSNIVYPDPFAIEIVTHIKNALKAEAPYSVVRIGDGEANLLSSRAYSETPALNHHAAESIVTMQKDRFIVDKSWVLILSDLIHYSLLNADIIGVIGLWRPNKPMPDAVAKNFLQDYRGISGTWRAVDYMLALAKKDFFKNKILASAHLYFSVLRNLSDILTCTKKLYLLTDRKNITDKFSIKYPSLKLEYLPVGMQTDPPINEKPNFLYSVYSMLPDNMKGTLSLIGAGPWAEIYCTWIKQKGGVAVDIGSGFDLMDGQITRPIHRSMGVKVASELSL